MGHMQNYITLKIKKKKNEVTDVNSFFCDNVALFVAFFCHRSAKIKLDKSRQELLTNLFGLTLTIVKCQSEEVYSLIS